MCMPPQYAVHRSRVSGDKLSRKAVVIGFMRSSDDNSRVSSNMLTWGANASPVERIASPVANICLPSQIVNFSQNGHLCNTFLLGASHGFNNKY